MDRSTWTIHQYIEELISLHEMEEVMDREQWHQIFTHFKNEMCDKFPPDVRREHNLVF